MLKKVIINFWGIAILSFAIFLTLALISFDANDPSFNRVIDVNKIANLTGTWGAFISGPLIEGFGITLILPLIYLYIVAINFIMKGYLRLIFLRTLLLFITIPILSLCLAYISSYFNFNFELGGVLGKFCRAELSLRYNNLAMFAMSLLASLIGIMFVFNTTFKKVRKIFNLRFNLFAPLFQKNSITTLEHFNNPVVFSEGSICDVEPLSSKIVPNDIAEVMTLKSKIIKPLFKNISSPSLNNANELVTSFKLPSLDLLKNIEKSKKSQPSEEILLSSSKLLHKVLDDFGVVGEITKIHPGPVVTLYEFEPVAGTKSSRVIGLSDDIARSMSAISARIAVIPGKSSLGVELPNSIREMVTLKELIESNLYTNTNEKLPIILGKNIGGEPIIADLAKMPHLLVAGTTGSGKSVAINTMILSLLFKHPPSECRFIMIDPKMLELSIYDGIPHLLAPVVTEPKKAISALKWVVKEMENRYKLMSLAGVRNLDGFNTLVADTIKNGKKLQKQIQVGFDSQNGKPKYEIVDIEENHLPYIVVIVDEMADLMIVAGKEIEGSIQRLAQMARAAGIHIIMATQRPSVDVITGVIKANFPTRISFQVTSKIDSRTILGEQGADQLLGMGDMLFMRGGGRIERVHGPFVSDSEVEKITNFLRLQGSPQYIENITVSDEDANNEQNENPQENDELYDQALAIVLKDRKASTSYIQRCLRIGYNRAANIIDRMERERVVSPPNHVGKREVLQA